MDANILKKGGLLWKVVVTLKKNQNETGINVCYPEN